MSHHVTLKCGFPGFYNECSCGWKPSHCHADRWSAEDEARQHKIDVEMRRAGKDSKTLKAHGLEPKLPPGKYNATEGDNGDLTVMFGGVPFLIEHKDDRCESCRGSGCSDISMGVYTCHAKCPACKGTGKRIPPEVAERQRLTYQQIIDREA